MLAAKVSECLCLISAQRNLFKANSSGETANPTELKGNKAELTSFKTLTFKVSIEPKISFWKAHHRHYEVKYIVNVISITSG